MITKHHQQLINLNKKIIESAPRFFEVDITELALKKRLIKKFTLKEQGITFSFKPIIAFGKNSAIPHHWASNTKLQKNNVVKIDLGLKQNGVLTDLTRTYFFGKKNTEFIQIEKHLKNAQQEAIKTLKPGVKSYVPDKAARDYLEKHNLAQYFIHSVGHGVGAKIHVRPYLTQKRPRLSQIPLKEGDIVTIEPGVYFKDKWGYRIEDMFLITKTGAKKLSK